MKRNPKLHLLCAVVAATVIVGSSPAAAISLNFVDGNEGLPLDSSLVNDDEIFGGNILVLSGAVTISGNIDVTASTVLLSATVDVLIPAQSQNLTLIPNPTVIASNPTGTATLVTEQEKTVGVGPTDLTNADLQDLNVLLLASQAIETNQVVVDGNAAVDILGLFTLNFDVTAAGNLVGTVNNLSFIQDAGTNGLLGSGNVNPSPNPPDDFTTQYTMSVPGTLAGNIQAGFVGDLTVDLGIFGSIVQDLSGLTALDQDILASLALPGVATLTDLEPGTPSGAGRDIQATFGLNLGGLPIPFVLSTSLTVPINIHTDIVNAIDTVDVIISGFVNLELDTTIVILGTNYQLQDSAPDVAGIPIFGDISGDGQVDIGDFTLWGNAFGETGAGLPADLSNDGIVDIGDFTIWGDNFGATSAVGGAASGDSVVPEPSSLWLIVIGALGFVPMLIRRLRRQGG